MNIYNYHGFNLLIGGFLLLLLIPIFMGMHASFKESKERKEEFKRLFRR